MAVTKFCAYKKLFGICFGGLAVAQLLLFSSSFFLYLIKTENALKLLKKYLGSILSPAILGGLKFSLPGTAGARHKQSSPFTFSPPYGMSENKKPVSR